MSSEKPRDLKNNPLIVRFTKPERMVRNRGIILFVMIILTHLLLYDESAQQYIGDLFNTKNEVAEALGWMLLPFTALFAVDVLLTVPALLSRKPALQMDAEGISGLHGWLWRKFTWEELYEVKRHLTWISIVRKPTNAIAKWSHRHTYTASHRRWGEYKIQTPLKIVDKDLEEIIAVLQQQRPDVEIQGAFSYMPAHTRE